MNKSTLAITLTLACSLLLISCKDNSNTAQQAPPPQAVTIAQPLFTKVTEWDYYTGKLEAKDRVELRARVSGYLDKTLFEGGTRVEEGDLLFVIDQRPYENALARAKANLQRTRAEMNLAKSEEKRAERLLEKRAMAAEEVEKREADVKVNEADVAAAMTEVQEAELNLQFAEIRAPFAGRITEALVDKGNLVTVGTTHLATIVSLDPIYAYVSADERSILKYRRLALGGNRVSARDAAVPVDIGLSDEEGYSYAGLVDYVEPEIDASMGTGSARAVIKNPDELLSPGLFVRLRVVAREPYEALLIPESAIGNDQGQKFVFVLGEDNTAEYRRVEPGPLYKGFRVIQSGLSQDDWVVILGTQRIRPSTKVNPEKKTLELEVTDSQSS